MAVAVDRVVHHTVIQELNQKRYQAEKLKSTPECTTCWK
jgi:hypothetical protein